MVALDQNTVEIIVFAGGALGIAGRTVMPYLKARTENDGALKFEAKYLFAAAYAAVLSIAGGIFLWPQIVPTVNPSMSVFGIFVLSFSAGWASNDIINSIQSSLAPKEAVAKLEATPTTTTTTTTVEQPKP